MAFANLARKGGQALALVLMGPALLVLAALPALVHASDLNNGKFERPPVGPGIEVEQSPGNLDRSSGQL